MRQPFERLLVGRTLAGRYELGDAIGAGGMSVVYRGVDRVLGRPVAVKVVSLPADTDEVRENLRERFRREAGSAARIAHHPNVVNVYDYGTDPELDLDFIVMELLRGRDLKQALARYGPLPLPEAMRVLRETARGLAAGHREGIVHRDVKPANIFLVGENARLDYVRILDFGIAKPLEPDDDALTLTSVGQLPHSPAYASPEQLDPEAEVTPASDVYQLGLVGYELLTGDRAYSEGERQRIAAGEEVPLVATPRWSAIPPRVREVIARALRRDPSARFADAAAFADALAGAEHEPGGEPEEGRAVFAPRGAAAHARDEETTDGSALPPPVLPPTPPAPADEIAPVEPVSDEPYQLPAAREPGRRRIPRAALAAAALALLLVLGVWAMARKRAASRESALAAADTGDAAALDAKFLRLEGAASTALESGAPDTAAAAPAAPDTGASVQESEAAGRQDAAAVQNAILDMHAAWSSGDVDRMLSHYADRVDYYGIAGATRDFIRSDREKSIQKYTLRRITINRQATLFVNPGLARVLVDKDWDFEGSGEKWTGSMRQEVMLRNTGGKWLIVSEKSNEVYRENRTPL